MISGYDTTLLCLRPKPRFIFICLRAFARRGTGINMRVSKTSICGVVTTCLTNWKSRFPERQNVSYLIFTEKTMIKSPEPHLMAPPDTPLLHPPHNHNHHGFLHFVASADGKLLSMTVPLSMYEISEYTWIDRLKHWNIKLAYMFIDQRVRRGLLKPSGGMCFGGGWNRRAMKAGGYNIWWGRGNMKSYTHSSAN